MAGYLRRTHNEICPNLPESFPLRLSFGVAWDESQFGASSDQIFKSAISTSATLGIFRFRLEVA